jgi:hypothetical protein
LLNKLNGATDGMDECDKAAQMLQCCKEKAPDVVNSVILALEKSISSEMQARIKIKNMKMKQKH